jgi:hypothetical protein
MNPKDQKDQSIMSRPRDPRDPKGELDTEMASNIFNTDTEATGFARSVLINGKNVLNYYTEKSNLEQDKSLEHAVIFNLSLKKIFENLSKTLIGLLDDLLKGHIHTIHDFFRGDRLLYLGILMVLLAFCVYLIDITS